jgi:hypothetical protein
MADPRHTSCIVTEDRNGALHVLYQTTFDGEPVLYWKEIQTTGNP